MSHALDQLLGIDPQDPEVLRATALAREDRAYIKKLIAARHARGWSQDDLAKQMGISQPTVAAFERYDSDPKLSTVRRYAQALEVLVCHHVVPDVGQLKTGAWPPAFGTDWTDVTVTASPTFSTTERAPVQKMVAAPERADLGRTR